MLYWRSGENSLRNTKGSWYSVPCFTGDQEKTAFATPDLPIPQGLALQMHLHVS